MKHIDQLNRPILLAQPPKRIVSLVPSQTELLFDLGLENEIVGITKFCIHPNRYFKSKTKIGGTKKVDIDKVIALQPDLIIANKEENDKAQIEALEKKFPVWISDVKNLEDAEDMILKVGVLTDKVENSKTLLTKIKTGFETLSSKKDNPNKPSALYLIWRKPFMSIGEDTFINDILAKTGFKNVLEGKLRYPILNKNEIQALYPQYILLSSEPYPFKEKHIEELQKICPSAVIKLVDGEFFSWYGSRLLRASSYLFTLQKEITR